MTDSTITFGNHRPSLLWLIKYVFCALLVSTAVSCAPTPYVWAGDIPADRAKPAADQSAIQPGDTIEVSILAQAGLSGRHVVGSDGTIAVPDVGSVPVAGLSVAQAEALLTKRLTQILATPQVSIVLLTRNIEVTVLGEVQTPGKFNLRAGDGVASALALAGGITEFGDENAVYLVRSTEQRRIRFRVKDLVRGGNSARAFALRDGDLLVIE